MKRRPGRVLPRVQRIAAALVMALGGAGPACASAFQTAATPPSPPSSDAWHCFHAIAPPGKRWVEASSHCDVSRGACEKRRARTMRDDEERAVEGVRSVAATPVRAGGDAHASPDLGGGVSRAGHGPSDGNDADQIGADEAESAATREAASDAGDGAGASLAGICELDPSACPYSEDRITFFRGALSPCTPASVVSCAPYRHEYNWYQDGPTIWAFDCMETAADCELFRNPKTYGWLHTVFAACVDGA